MKKFLLKLLSCMVLMFPDQQVTYYYGVTNLFGMLPLFFAGMVFIEISRLIDK